MNYTFIALVIAVAVSSAYIEYVKKKGREKKIKIDVPKNIIKLKEDVEIKKIIEKDNIEEKKDKSNKAK